MEIKESRPKNYYWRPCGSLHRNQFSITCKPLIIKDRISWGLSIDIMNKMYKLNTEK